MFPGQSGHKKISEIGAVARDTTPKFVGVKWQLIAPKRLKLRTSNLTHMFPGTART